MSGRGALAAVTLAAALTLTGCLDESPPSPEVSAEFAARWPKLSSGEQTDACWAVTAQMLPDQQAVAMARLSELFGNDWTKMTGPIEDKC